MKKIALPKSAQLPVLSLSASGIVVIVVLVAAVFVHHRYISSFNSNALEVAAEQQVVQQVDAIKRFIEEKNRQVSSFASRSSILKSISEPSDAMRATALQGLNNTFNNARAIRIFGLDREEKLSNQTTELSFTELDMINRAERGETVYPEALKRDDTWQLFFAAPVRKDQASPTIGSILLSFDANELFAIIDRESDGKGRLALLREAPGQPITVYSSGQGDSIHTAEKDIPQSFWTVRFVGGENLADNALRNSLPFWSISLLASVLLAALCWFAIAPLDPRRQKTQDSNDPFRMSVDKKPPSSSEAFDDILDIDLSADEEHLLLDNRDETRHKSHNKVPQAQPEGPEIPSHVFRAYDIRGKSEYEITLEFARLLGQAFASEALAAGKTSLIVARDGRNDSLKLSNALVDGILSTGCHVINIGAVPTPLLYFATHELPDADSGIIVTASHNAAQYNGFKMVLGRDTLIEQDVARIRSRMENGNFDMGLGNETSVDIAPSYIERIFSDIALAGNVNLVIDAANGITGSIAPRLFEELGCRVDPLFCEIDGHFPNHDPDPTVVTNLTPLIERVKSTGADLGIALDGDGDRVVVVTPAGEIIWPDRLLMLFAKDIVSGNPGADVVFDVKSTRELNALISSYGGRPIMWKTGHSNMKSKIKETGALVGGEMSGHIFIKDRWYGFDDGMYAAARLLEIMTLRDQSIDELFASFPVLPSTPEIKIYTGEDEKFVLMNTLSKRAQFGDGRVNNLDGLRVEFLHGWGLVRASNTSPALTLRFEAETEEHLRSIQAIFKEELRKIDPDLKIPF